MKTTIFMKKLLALCLSAGCLFSGLPQAHRVNAEQVRTVHNLVLFAQFEDPAEYNFMADRAETIDQICNDEDTVRSLAGYIDTISYGQMQVECHFPQLQDGVITPYQMSQPESEYLNADIAALEAVQNITVPDDIPLDGNNDGVIDNIILIVDASAEGSGDLFWPCAFSVAGLTINGKDTGMLNLHNSNSIFENTITGGAGVMSHEFLHSMGYPDLYRNDTRSGIPVGQWDIMASNSVFVQYPLAYMRASVSGWLEEETITENGTYTLVPASLDSGNRLYLLKTPLSDTEFFAVEFRQKGAAYSEEMDVKIYGTGMVVYRVNTQVSGNYNGDKDGIYVFRPGETGLDAGEGDIFSSYYGGEGMATEIGSLDFSDTITDGALVYSDGTNSGIRLSDITINGDSLTFRAEFSPTENIGLWQTAATIPSSEVMGLSLDMAKSEDGDIYLFCSESGGGTLYCYSNSQLETIAHMDGICYNGKIAVIDDTPYLLYNDVHFNWVLAKYDGAWQTLAQGTQSAQYMDLCASGDDLYIAYTEGSFPYALSVMQYDTQENTSQPLGGVIAENACSISLAVTGTDLNAVYRDIADSSRPKCAVWNGTAWNTTTLSEDSCNSVEAAADGDTLCIAVTGDINGIYLRSDDDLSFKEYPALEGSPFSASPAVENGVFYTMINTQNADDLSMYGPVSGTMERCGNSIDKELVNSPVCLISQNTMYAAYLSPDSTLLFKKLRLSNTAAVHGDVNADGACNVLDIIAFQKYLLTVGTLADSGAADLHTDGRIDVADLAILKKMLIVR